VIVLGIDPGTASLGYGVVERAGGGLREIEHGCLTTTPSMPLPERLMAIHTRVAELIATHHPTFVAVERLFFSRNAQTAIGVGHARGVVLLAAAEARLPVREATPSEVKTAVSGSGVAEKEQVGRMVATILGLASVPTPDDAADALAVAIWAANRERIGEEHVSTVLDRSAIAPMTAGVTPFERAVREALARERAASPKTAPRPPRRSAS
jgi:crossover junction endodeoxyribonuclease RuvC